jgi:CheY-like chemotaxis protein
MTTTVLVVDDDPIQRRLLESMINRLGYQAMTAERGEQALSMLLGTMKAPIEKFVRTLAAPHTKLVRTVDAVRDQKQGAAA